MPGMESPLLNVPHVLEEVALVLSLMLCEITEEGLIVGNPLVCLSKSPAMINLRQLFYKALRSHYPPHLRVPRDAADESTFDV